MTIKQTLLLMAIILTIAALLPGFAADEPASPAVEQSVPAPAASQPAAPPVITPAALPELIVPPLPAGTKPSISTDQPVILKEAIKLALQYQPQLTQSAAALSAAEGRLKQVESGRYPTIGVSAQYNKTGPAESGGSNPGIYTTSFSGRQLVYDFGRTPAEVSQARNQREATRQALEQTRQELINGVKQAYYILLQNQRLVEVQHLNLTDQQAHLEEAKARFDVGVAPRADVVRAETAVADAVLTLASAQNFAAISRVNLNLAIGLDPRTPIKVAETEEAAPSLEDPAAFVERAFNNRPEMKQARANLKAAQEALKVARTNNLPALSASASYGWSGIDFPPDTLGWSYGAALSWPFFDVGMTKGLVQTAKANVTSAQASLVQTEQFVSSDVVQAYLNLQTAVEKVAAAKAGVVNAEESIRLATGRYQAGVAAYIEVIDAQTALVTAQTNQVNALYGLSTARAAFEKALGIAEGE
jgi:outer membrane protein TolC